MTLPFNVQAAISSRCTFILRQFQHFLSFHSVENFGCDFAATGLVKEKYVEKLSEFFLKRKPTDEAYDTYLLYYCGPTSHGTDKLSFIDGQELDIEEIVNLWKETHVKKTPHPVIIKTSNNTDSDSKSAEDESTSETPAPELTQSSQSRPTSRLVIVLDSEHTSKALDYVRSKLVEANVFVALQSCKYNYAMSGNGVTDSGKINQVQEGSLGVMGPGSPQANLSNSATEAYLNFGKFTLDWLKSNYYDSRYFTGDLMGEDITDNFHGAHSKPFDEEREHLRLDSDDEDDDNDSQDELDMEVQQAERQMSLGSVRRRRTSTLLGKTSERVFYEAKCAFSRYWIDFSLQEQTFAHDFDQFWRVYYPYSSCKPLLQLVNCRVFYWKFHLLKRTFFYLRRVKTHLMPIHEYETGHGFKLFSS